VACSIENLERYQLCTAQTWEHQALTRARFIAGDPALGVRVDEITGRALGTRRDPVALGQEVGAMRERIFREHGDDDPWNLKHARGGLVEAEFLAQYLQLRLLPDHPAMRTVSTEQAFLQAAGAGALRPADARLLVDAVRLYRRLQAVLRLSVQDRFAADSAPAGLRHALLRAAHGAGTDLPRDDLTALEEELRATQVAVSRVFRRFCPAEG
jgi:glutamate-ammonia-ligase adenylyltransferase